jgi:hypothetical protein
MAEASTREERPEVADYYQCTAGFTVGVHVCSEDEVVPGSAMGFTKENPPLSEEEQEELYGQVMYTEYEAEEEELPALKAESGRLSALMGMQSPTQPPVTPASLEAQGQPLDMLSRQDLQAKAKKLGLNFPDDTDREQMIGAIEKKQKEGGEEGGRESAVIEQRRQTAKEAIEKANQDIASGGSSGGGGGGSSTPRRSRPAQLPSPEAPDEEEER